MRTLYVAGLGFWAPGYPTLEARLGGVPDAACVEPPCALLPPRLARRASLLTRMTLEAIGQAAAEATVDVRQAPTVFATSRGEMQTLCELLEMLTDDGQLSPTRFHNSVYNAAAGQFSVAVGNPAFSTTLVGGNEAVPLALLEAFCVVHAPPTDTPPPAVIVALGDEAISLPFVPSDGSESLACALCLTREPPTGRRVPTLSVPARAPPGASSEPPHSLANPVLAALPLLRGLRSDTETGPVRLATPEGWQTQIGRPEAIR